MSVINRTSAEICVVVKKIGVGHGQAARSQQDQVSFRLLVVGLGWRLSRRRENVRSRAPLCRNFEIEKSCLRALDRDPVCRHQWELMHLMENDKILWTK